MSVALKIKGWEKFQHFKDRRPPWIKLYREILDDPDWFCITGDDAKLLVGLWLLASEDENQNGALPDARRIAFRLRISEKQLNQALTRLSHWLIQDDIGLISERYQVDAPETETETETEGETETETRQVAISKKSQALKPESVSKQVWEDWLVHRKEKKAVVTKTVIEKIQSEAVKAGIGVSEALELMCLRGWVGFNAGWVEEAIKGTKIIPNQIDRSMLNAEQAKKAIFGRTIEHDSI